MLDIHSELVEKCRKGDARSQYRLYKLYSNAMFNICTRMVMSRLDAEDILQESFVLAFKNIKNFKGESTFGAWLKRIVINNCISFLRKKKQIFLEIDDNKLLKKGDFIEDEEKVIDVKPEVINNAIKELPDKARVVFTLYLLEGYKHKDIAEILSISESTSKTQYQRAKILMKDKLEKSNRIC